MEPPPSSVEKPYSTASVETMDSLAITPLIRATAACQVPKPRGLNTGAIKPPIMPMMLSELLLIIFSLKSKLCKNHSMMLIIRMMVPARVRKSLTLIHMCFSVFFKTGILYGGSSMMNGAGLFKKVFLNMKPERTAKATPTHIRRTREAPCCREKRGGDQGIYRHFCRAAHERHQHHGHFAVLFVFHGARAHQGGTVQPKP